MGEGCSERLAVCWEDAEVEHWLAKIAKNQAIEAHWRLARRLKRVSYRVEMAAKMRDAGGKG